MTTKTQARSCHPELIAVHELPNPYSKDGAKFFRERQRGGVRLMIQRR